MIVALMFSFQYLLYNTLDRWVTFQGSLVAFKKKVIKKIYSVLHHSSFLANVLTTSQTKLAQKYAFKTKFVKKCKAQKRSNNNIVFK